MDAKSDLVQTEQTREEDEKTLAALGQSCASFGEDKCPDLRSCLFGDDVRSLFGSTASFMQVSASTRAVFDQSSQVDAAANACLLAFFSMRVQLDNFAVGNEAIDGMILAAQAGWRSRTASTGKRTGMNIDFPQTVLGKHSAQRVYHTVRKECEQSQQAGVIRKRDSLSRRTEHCTTTCT